MATKKTKTKKTTREEESVADAANKIWKAGIGALRTAEEEGSRIFKSLIEKGEDLQASTKKMSQEQIDKIAKSVKGGIGSVKGKIEDITDQKESVWSVLKLEDVFMSVMKTFGVATKQETDILKKKIDVLLKDVRELKGATKSSSAKAKAAPKATDF
jgi:poly(hydroxyalkanoate) granule-associated protein